TKPDMTRLDIKAAASVLRSRFCGVAARCALAALAALSIATSGVVVGLLLPLQEGIPPAAAALLLGRAAALRRLLDGHPVDVVPDRAQRLQDGVAVVGEPLAGVVGLDPDFYLKLRAGRRQPRRDHA